MPLSKEKNRARMRLERARVRVFVQPTVQPAPQNAVQPETPRFVQPSNPKIAELQAMIHDIEDHKAVQPPQDSFIPRYQLGVSKAGDRVRMRDGSIVTVPELDGEGNPIGW